MIFAGIENGIEGSIITFNIEKNCLNAAKIESIGSSYVKDEDETLIPPYSVCTVVKRDDYEFELNLAFDNKDYDLSQKVIH